MNIGEADKIIMYLQAYPLPKSGISQYEIATMITDPSAKYI
jgi:hypothetical protein